MVKLAHINVRSLLLKVNDIKDIIASNEIDILTVSETWLSKNISDNEVHIDGFTFLRHDRNGRRGGVGIYIHNSFRYSILSTCDLTEQIWIELCLNVKIIIGDAYKQPQLNYRFFLDEIENSIGSFMLRSEKVYCLGDFNIDFLNTDNPNTSYLTQMLDSFGAKQLIEQPTRVTGTSMSLLDIL